MRENVEREKRNEGAMEDVSIEEEDHNKAMMTHTLTISNSLHSLISLQNLSLCVLGLKPHLNAPLKGTLA